MELFIVLLSIAVVVLSYFVVTKSADVKKLTKLLDHYKSSYASKDLDNQALKGLLEETNKELADLKESSKKVVTPPVVESKPPAPEVTPNKAPSKRRYKKK